MVSTKSLRVAALRLFRSYLFSVGSPSFVILSIISGKYLTDRPIFIDGMRPFQVQILTLWTDVPHDSATSFAESSLICAISFSLLFINLFTCGYSITYVMSTNRIIALIFVLLYFTIYF